MFVLYILKAKLKEERDAKRNTLDDRHFYIFQIATDRLGLEKNEVEEASLEGNQVNAFRVNLDKNNRIASICILRDYNQFFFRRMGLSHFYT